MTESTKKEHFAWIMTLYLLGLFLGSLTMGVITPVRTIIQSSLGVDASTGIWMINIFTLMYAAVIPVSGKLADRYGRKVVFLLSILLFGVGSLVCGLSNGAGSFSMLLLGRVIQGLGAGGIMPIATAEFGTSFPVEKRGMALGLVGGVYGIGSVLGATVGSAVVDIFGTAAWQWVFYLNIPFCVFIIALGLVYIPNHKAEQVFKIDALGTLLMVVIIISLLYGLKNIDFFDFWASFSQWQAWGFIALAVLLTPLFVWVEKRAEDPIFHIEYLSNKQIVLTLIISLLVGMVMMGMVFIPQFAENALKISSGAGGYFVIVLGVFAGAVSPISGVLIDRFGEKGVMMIGLIISALGAFYLAFVAATWLNVFNVIVSLVLIGLGMGFTMGTPLNYMMLANTKDEESNSALATLSLVRSIGTAVAPALMVGFIIQAAAGLQTELMEALPDMPAAPALSQKAELEDCIDELEATDAQLQSIIAGLGSMGQAYASNMNVSEQLAAMDLESMLNMDTASMDMDMSGNDSMELPADLLDKMQNSDVTTIVGVTQEMVDWIFSDAMAGTIEDIQAGIQKGIDGIGEGITGIQSGIDAMGSAMSGMSASTGMSAMGSSAMSGMSAMGGSAMGSSAMGSMMAAISQLSTLMTQEKEQMLEMQSLMKDMKDEIPAYFDEINYAYQEEISAHSAEIEDVYQQAINRGYRSMFILVGIFSVIALILLLFYKPADKPQTSGHGHGHGHGNAAKPAADEAAQDVSAAAIM